MSSNFSLILVNLFVGMCRGSLGLPRRFRELGYQDKWIERSFLNQDHDDVHPELIIASPDLHNAILLEAKSGQNTEADQLRRYSRVTVEDLRRQAYLDAEETGTYDVMIVGKEEFLDRLRIGIEEEGYEFPLVVANEAGLRLALNEFALDEVTGVFRPELEVEWGAVPMGWIPFDHASELWEVAEAVIPEVLARMVKREPRIHRRSICQASSTWDIIGQPERRQMEARVGEVFEEACSREFNDYLSVAGNAVEVIQNPMELDAPRSSLGFKKLQRLQEEFLTRLRSEGDQLELPM